MKEQIVALRKAGVGPREIARRLSVSPSVVAGHLFRAGLTKPTKGRGNGATTEWKRLAVAALEHSTWRQVCEDYQTDLHTLGIWRREVAA